MNQVPLDVLYLISSFVIPTHYTLRTDIPRLNELLDKKTILLNPRSFYQLHVEKEDREDKENKKDKDVVSLAHTKYIDWANACMNENDKMVDQLLHQFELMPWNTGDVEWWKKWHRLALNKNDRIVSYFIDNVPHTIHVFLPLFCKNSNERMVWYLWEHFRDNIDWVFFSKNTSDAAMDILFNHIERIDWESANENPHPRMVEYVLSHPECIRFSLNKNTHPRVFTYLLSRPDIIDWKYLSLHPDVFVANEEERRKDIIQWTRQTLL